MADRDESVGMLNEIYQAAEMGAEGTKLLRGKSEDGLFNERLQDYTNKYGAVKDEAARLLSKYGAAPKEAGAMDKAGLWMDVQWNTALDKTPSHMAEILIAGSTAGTVQGVKNKNAHPRADPLCRELEDQFLSLQQEYAEDMKKFLV